MTFGRVYSARFEFPPMKLASNPINRAVGYLHKQSCHHQWAQFSWQVGIVALTAQY